MPTCIFWVYSAPDILNARLDARVDSMVKVFAMWLWRYAMMNVVLLSVQKL
jgi:hypothetical protein